MPDVTSATSLQQDDSETLSVLDRLLDTLPQRFLGYDVYALDKSFGSAVVCIDFREVILREY